MKPFKIVAVSAGLSRPSSTRLLADRLAEATRKHLGGQERPVEVQVVELRELATDISHNMVSGFPSASLRGVLEAVAEADGVIAVTPIFTASYSGLFKSFFDIMDNTSLAAKPVLIAATGGTARHSLALDFAVRPLMSYLRATVVPTAVFAATDDWGSAPDAGTDQLAARIDAAGGELAGLILGRSDSGGPDSDGRRADEDAVVPFEQQMAALGIQP